MDGLVVPSGGCLLGADAVGGQVAEALFADGLCLPSGSNLAEEELARVVGVVQRLWQRV